MFKASLLFISFILIFPASGIAQLCTFGRGQIEVVNKKKEPVKDFKVDFYSLENFDLSNRKKIMRVEYVSNAWDIFLTRKEAEKYIAEKSAFNVFSERFQLDEKEKKDSVIYYRDNIYNYRTLLNFAAPVLIKISARKYKKFYFISPAFSGCYYYNKITLKKK